jgi:hypothetical protein
MIGQSRYARLSHFGQVAGEREEKHWTIGSRDQDSERLIQGDSVKPTRSSMTFKR